MTSILYTSQKTPSAERISFVLTHKIYVSHLYLIVHVRCMNFFYLSNRFKIYIVDGQYIFMNRTIDYNRTCLVTFWSRLPRRHWLQKQHVPDGSCYKLHIYEHIIKTHPSNYGINGQCINMYMRLFSKPFLYLVHVAME